MLVIGAALFIAVGCLVMTAVDSVPSNLVVNALVLGTLSIVTGMVFVLDTCLSNRRDGKKSHLTKNTRYGDIARTRAAPDTERSTNGVQVNGVGHANGGILKWETVEKKQNGLLKTTEANGHAAEIGNGKGVQSPPSATSEQDADVDDGVVVAPMVHHQYGRKNTDNRGFDGHRYADWYDTEMDLSKMKKLEINVPTDDSPNYRHK